MTSSELKKLIIEGENKVTEFKENIPNAKTLAKHIISFGNENGGNIILGVNKNRQPIGISSKIAINTYNKALNLIAGNPDTSIESLHYNGKKVSVIKVRKSVNLLALYENPTARRTTQRNSSKQSVSTESSDKNDFFNFPYQNIFSFFPEEENDYSTPLLDEGFSDADIPPCFGVDNLASAFYDLIRHITVERNSKSVNTTIDNVCFLGVFGKWGRGKSFFLKRLKVITSQSDFADCFDFITFNAWKYQDTPGIWAHLIHTLINHKPKYGRIRFRLSWNFLGELLLAVGFLALAVFGIILAVNDYISNEKKDALIVFFGSMVSFTLSFIAIYKTFSNGELKIGPKYVAEKYLGAQHQSETELLRVLSRWNWGHTVNLRYHFDCSNMPERIKLPSRKIVLLVEDIDRCDDEKMIKTIESLKLVMDNPEIARRLIVIISVDIDRLLHAYEAYFKRKGDPSPIESTYDQLNKIFLVSMAFPKLTREDLKEYVDVIASNSVNKSMSSQNNISPDTPATIIKLSQILIFSNLKKILL